MSTFGLARPAANQNNQTGKGLLFFNRFAREFQKMIPVATDDDSLLLLRKIENDFVGSCDWQNFPQPLRFVFPIPQQLFHFVRHVVVENKFHASVSLICSATRASISVRWSS